MLSRRPVSAMLVVVVLTVLSAAAAAQDTCKPFGGTIYAWHDGKAWVGEGDFAIGREVLHAKITDVNTSLEQHSDMWWGTETATFDFGSGNKVDLITEFTTEHMQNPAGVFHVNENGTFANGAGRLQKAFGHFNSQGPFGPGVTLPPGKTKPPAGAKMFWIGHYDGTVCNVTK